jgi:hypothetical protein
MSRYYPSKIDWWIYASMTLAIIAIVGSGITVWIVEPEEAATALPIVVTAGIAAIGLPVILLRGTGYTLEPTRLLITSGPMKWVVPLADIHSIAPTRKPLSSPALSLDRLLIVYGRDYKQIMISPDDKAGFLRELEMLRAQLPVFPGA